MKSLVRIAVTIAVTLCFAQAVWAQSQLEQRVAELEKQIAEMRSPSSMHGYWDSHGPRFETADQRFVLGVHARLQFDSGAFLSADDALESQVGGLSDGTKLRRVRPRLNATLYKRLHVQIQYDFAHAHDPHIKDTFMMLGKVPTVGHIKVGSFKEPFGLEEMTSSKYTTFLERSMTNALQPKRNLGFLLYNTAADDRMTWAIGGFQTSDLDGEDVSHGDYDVTGRFTWLPVCADKGRRLVHLGVSGLLRNDKDQLMRIAARPETVIAPAFVNTGDFSVDNVAAYGAEAACVLGPFSMQGEYTTNDIDRIGGEEISFKAWYGMASMFLTGEHRRYKKSNGSFSNTVPLKSYPEGGWGAIELVARYDHIDLTDGSITGGEMETITAGLNWYLNPGSKIMFHYVNADLDGVGKTDMVTSRFQVHF